MKKPPCPAAFPAASKLRHQRADTASGPLNQPPKRKPFAETGHALDLLELLDLAELDANVVGAVVALPGELPTFITVRLALCLAGHLAIGGTA